MTKMSVRNPKNLLTVGGVVVALLVGTVLLGGFAQNEPAVTDAATSMGACPATGCGGCPMAKADSTAHAKMADNENSEGCPYGGVCPTDCPKPCCEKKCCDKAKSSACCSSDGETDVAKQ